MARDDNSRYGTIESGDRKALLRAPPIKVDPIQRKEPSRVKKPSDPEPVPQFQGFKRGGKVKKTGLAKVHKGERVLTAGQAKKPALRRALRARKR